MTPVIRIDDQVMDELKKQAIGLGLVFEPPNATLRRILGLDAPVRDMKEMRAIANKIVQDALTKHGLNKNMIELKLAPSSRKYLYIPIPRDKRYFFPGYKESFQLETDVGMFAAHVPYPLDIGGHIRGRFGPWFAKHTELKAGDRLRIEALEPGKRYNLSVVSKGI